MNLFSELNLSSALQSNLEKNKFSKPTPVQAEAIPPALEALADKGDRRTIVGRSKAAQL